MASDLGYCSEDDSNNVSIGIYTLKGLSNTLIHIDLHNKSILNTFELEEEEWN